MSFYPKFNKGSILQKNMLEALQNNPVDAIRLFYRDYGQGIIKGFDVTVDEGGTIEVAAGILKIDNDIFFSTQSLSIAVQDGTNYVYLKKLQTEQDAGITVTFELESSNEPHENEFELFRYVKNAVLKKYSSFSELNGTQRNRINQQQVKYAIPGGSTISPEIFKLYAEAVFNKKFDVEDIIFAYSCLNETLTKPLIDKYFGKSETNEQLIKLMREKLSKLGENNIVEDKPAPVARPTKTMVYN